ncbi:hypothetical protein PCANC_15474 [Puccinia coronata f. sp. avenae]|uniref:Uncharacterized protein n=1 Tax=Puccinia coronata f. sp. avenae TaxID=200324 RepID=A0A2N5SZ62_9BASI|nr:hypothetical protein PCANC_16179 [Puccinia coronata f. sp. avenae]PLW48690.1 hypothetical protein PCANC_15474 [Puccinia coronata f. sp. avenae]
MAQNKGKHHLTTKQRAEVFGMVASGLNSKNIGGKSGGLTIPILLHPHHHQTSTSLLAILILIITRRPPHS